MAGILYQTRNYENSIGDFSQFMLAKSDRLLGPVPVLSASGRRTLGNSEAFIEGSVEGFYAPIRYLNLRDVDVIGWLYDAAVRVGVPTGQGSEAFLGIRALGGGADGTGREPSVWTVTQTEPRYTWNNLNLVALTLGARLR